MASPKRVIALPEATTLEKNALVLSEPSLIFDTELNAWQVTKDGGTNWYSVLDSSSPPNPVSLQDAYDDSLPTPTILQTNVNQTKIACADESCGFIFSTPTGNSFFIIYGEYDDQKELNFDSSNAFASPDNYARIVGQVNGGGHSFAISWDVTDVGIGTEAVDATFTATSPVGGDTFLKYIGLTSTIQVKNDTTKVLDTIATLSDVTLQKGYANDDGTIAVDTGKPFTIIGEDSADNASVNLYTPIKLTGNTVSSLLFFGNNDFNNKIKYGEILTKIASPIVGSESAKEIFNVMDSGTLKTYLELNGDTKSVDVLENLNVTTINNIEPSGGLFLQTADGVLLTASTVETSVLGTGIGSLSVPANSFEQSGFKFDVSGTLDAFNNDTLTLRLVSNFGGTPVNLATINVSLEAAVGQFFEIEADFAIRAVGGAGVARIMTNFDFTYNRNTGNEFVGQRAVVANNVTFDTTISNTLYLTAQFSSANAGNSLQTMVGTLTRTF